MLGELNHALKNLAVLREEEIFRAQFFDGCVEGMIIEKDGAEDAALRFEIVREGAFDRGVCGSHSLYFRLGLFGMQEAEFLLRCGIRARSIYFCMKRVAFCAWFDGASIARARLKSVNISEKWKTRISHECAARRVRRDTHGLLNLAGARGDFQESWSSRRRVSAISATR